MQIDRLLKIVNILIDKRKVSAKELASEFGVSTKTIYRDIDTLSIAGIPIITTKGKNGGISILETYKVSKTLLTNDEQGDVIKGLEMLNALKYTDARETLTKLKSLFDKTEYNLIDIDFSYWGSDKFEAEKFKLIKEGLFNDKKISFEYIDVYGEKSTREVYPLRLVFKEKFWYLSGYCLKRNDYRIFNTYRITAVRVFEDSFSRRDFIVPEIKSDIKWKGDYKECILKFSSNCIRRVYSEFPVDKIEKLASGELLIRDSCILDNWFFNHILSYGGNVEVIEPVSLKDDIVEYLERSLKIYKNNL